MFRRRNISIYTKRVLLVLLLMLGTACAMQSGFGNKKEVIPSIKPDIKFIRCQVCELVAKEAHAGVAQHRAELPHWKKVTEEDIMTYLETLCDPKLEEGTWIIKQDIQEDGEVLRVVDMGTVRSCPADGCPAVRIADQPYSQSPPPPFPLLVSAEYQHLIY